MKRPAFQFYPADWRKDAALQLCSIGARGLWLEMLCLMHEAEPYGHLVAAGRAVDAGGLARLVGESAKDVNRWLAELQGNDVYSVTGGGIIFSRRMVRDQKERDEWAMRQHKHRDKSVTTSVTNSVTDYECHTDVTPMSQLSSSSSSSSKQFKTLVGFPPTGPKKSRSKRVNGTEAYGSRLAKPWSLPDDWKAWAVAYRPDWNEERVIRESLVFRDYWHGISGTRARKADWLATWRNWIRKAT